MRMKLLLSFGLLLFVCLIYMAEGSTAHPSGDPEAVSVFQVEKKIGIFWNRGH